MVYDKAESIYGNPLPYNIEERLASELYGDEPFNTIKRLTPKGDMSDEEYNKIIYAKLHKVMRSYKEGVINLFKEENPNITEDEIKEK